MPEEPHVSDSLPGYALGALEPDEARRVDAHLAGCLICRRELDALDAAAAELALAAPRAGPAPGLKPRLMGRVRALPAPEPVPVSRRRLPALAWAALLAIVALAASNVMLWSRLTRPVLAGPQGMRAIALQSTDLSPGGSGFVVVGADGLNGVLVVDRLPQLDAAREYQVWLVDESLRLSAGLFAVDETGYRGVRLAAERSLLSFDALEVTIEPAGGSDHPTGGLVLEGSLPRP
jgi:anti-sigma-K factor RskA